MVLDRGRDSPAGKKENGALSLSQGLLAKGATLPGTYKNVVATDTSVDQLSFAEKLPN
ncbi:hypothetical protein ACLOJK_038014, partial [Asimina triloba]